MTSNSSPQMEAFKAITVHTKVKSVLLLLHGEDVDTVADDLGVSSARLLRWQERFVEGGRASLLRRRTDESAHSQKRRQKRVQWTVLVIGLVLMILVITKVFAVMVQRGG